MIVMLLKYRKLRGSEKNMQDPFTPHITSQILRPYTDQLSAHSHYNDHKQRELIGRDVSECLVMRIIFGQRQRGLCE